MRVQFSWVVAIAFLCGAMWGSYQSDGVGWSVMISVWLAVAFANGYLGIRDRRIGIAAGGTLSVLMAVTCLGSSKYHPVTLFVFSAAAVGFLFGSVPVSTIESETDDADEKSNFKSGSGGDFGGGGASGKY